MGWDGSGNYNRVLNWSDDSDAAIKIKSDRHDTNDDDMAQALSNCLTKDGQSQPISDLPMNNHRLLQVADPVDQTDAVNKKYVDAIKTFSTNLDLSGADANGRLNFTSTTGANGITWKGADLSWLARLATAAVVGPPAVAATINRLVLNDKPDGTGGDVIELREDGTGKFTARVDVTGGSAAFRVGSASGNAHLYLMNGDFSTARAIIYTAGQSNGNLIFQPAAGGVYQMGIDGNFYLPGGSYMGGNGNVVGSIWSGWGASDAFSAINARIEARAQAWADAKVNNAVTSSRSAGFLDMTIFQGGSGGGGETSGYWVSGVWTTPANTAIRVTSRQPQLYIPNIGWFAAFNF